MQFLKKLALDNEEEAPSSAVRIQEVVSITVQCDRCPYWGKMQGGQIVSTPDKGVFECPECTTLKYVKWMFG